MDGATPTTEQKPGTEIRASPAEHPNNNAMTAIEIVESKRADIDGLITTPGVNADRAIAALKMAMLKDPKLRRCTPASLLDAVMKAVSWGLDPTGNSNSGWYLSRENRKAGTVECQLMPGYGGLVEMAIRRGIAKTIRPGIVYDCDEFEYEMGTDPFIKHRPGLERDKNAAVTPAYAVAHFGDGIPPQFDVLCVSDLDAIKVSSQGGGSNYSPWNGPFAAEMCKKSAIRRLCKNLPCDGVMADAVAMAHRDDVWEGRGFDVSQMTGTKPSSPILEAAADDAEGGE